MADDRKRPSEEEKRRVYVAFFVIAFLIDFVLGYIRFGFYQPTLIGMAIMIAAAIFFIYSFIKER